MIKYALWKIKPGKRKIWEDWCKGIMERYYHEASETLLEENLLRERCILFGEGDDSYVFYEHETVQGKEKLPFNPEKELNQKHFSIFHECLEAIPGKLGVVGYDVKALDKPQEQ